LAPQSRGSQAKNTGIPQHKAPIPALVDLEDQSQISSASTTERDQALLHHMRRLVTKIEHHGSKSTMRFSIVATPIPTQDRNELEGRRARSSIDARD